MCLLYMLLKTALHTFCVLNMRRWLYALLFDLSKRAQIRFHFDNNDGSITYLSMQGSRFVVVVPHLILCCATLVFVMFIHKAIHASQGNTDGNKS